MNPVDYLKQLRFGRARQMGINDSAVEAPQADQSAFPTHTDPELLLNFMSQQHQDQKDANESGYSRGYATEMSPGEDLELARARNYGVPTMWGKIMNRRMGGIQGRGVAGALGKSINPAAGSPSLRNFQDNALQEQYPFADLIKRFR